jgi:hypothetical protein
MISLVIITALFILVMILLMFCKGPYAELTEKNKCAIFTDRDFKLANTGKDVGPADFDKKIKLHYYPTDLDEVKAYIQLLEESLVFTSEKGTPIIEVPYKDIIAFNMPGHSMVTGSPFFVARFRMKISYRKNNEIKNLQFSYSELQRDYIQTLRTQIIEKSPNIVTMDRIKRLPSAGYKKD